LANESQNPTARLEEFRKQGRLFSIKFDYQKQLSLSSMLVGPVGIGTQVIEYRDPTGAKNGYELIINDQKARGEKTLSAGKLGDQSFATQYNYKSGDMEAVRFTIVVQRRNMVSIVGVWGVSGGTSADDAYKLAVIAAKRLE
jgi:hypothetical protein